MPDLGTFPEELALRFPNEEQRDRLWIARFREASGGEVPPLVWEGKPGSTFTGLYCWKGVCKADGAPLYLSVAARPGTVRNALKVRASRLDDPRAPGFNARPLEIALLHHPGIPADALAAYLHRLRGRWPYYADEVSLPVPFPFARKAKEYALSPKDEPETSEEGN